MLNAMYTIMMLLPSSLIMLSANTYANIQVSFADGAPKDKFVIQNISECNIQNIAMTIDLLESTGRLIFDTTATGKGVEVFQPFEVTTGQITLNSARQFNDGDTQLSLNISSIKANDSVSFTIDVDDTLTESEFGNIRVTAPEISGGSVALKINNNKTSLTASFDKNGKAMLVMPECIS